MPMYYPDLKSVQECAKQMARNGKGKEYRGLIPVSDAEVPQARRELGKYFREVWHDVVAAIEVEQAADQGNYHEALLRGISAEVEAA